MSCEFLIAAGFSADNLTDDEANELDTLIFRVHGDLPFDMDDQARMQELEAKAR